MSDSPAVILYDAAGIAMYVQDGVTIPANTKGLLIHGYDESGYARSIRTDAEGVISVSNRPPKPPSGVTEFAFVVDEAELSVGQLGGGGDVLSPHTTLGSIIENEKQVVLQSIETGMAGDSSESGTAVEIYWREGGGPTDHLVERIFVFSETLVLQLPDVTEARDGTSMVGDGSTTRLIVVRTRYSRLGLPVDFVVRGYTE